MVRILRALRITVERGPVGARGRGTRRVAPPATIVISVAVALLLVQCGVVFAAAALEREPVGSVLSGPPDHPVGEARYVIYLHGAILESRGANAVHPEYGRYEYAAILDSMARRGAVVLSELREQGTDGAAYAARVAAWVDTLLSSGVPPEHVTVMGFSKGGGIAMRASSLISNGRVNYVFMACCPREMAEWPEVKYRGRILSIHESSDTFAGSCRRAVLGAADVDAGAAVRATIEEERQARAGRQVAYEELEISTGLKHGAFYRPLDEWLDPAMQWAIEAGKR